MWDYEAELKAYDVENLQELLRCLLEEIRKKGVIEHPSKLRAAVRLATNRDLNYSETSHALSDFLGGTQGMRDEKIEHLLEFLYRTRLGRALLHPEPTTKHPYEAVLEPLIANAPPEGVRFEGLWLVYHGSYKFEGRVAVHLMKVKSESGGILSVTDYISENQHAGEPRLRNSSGCMTFVNGQVQILTHGRENRVGYSLFSGSPDIGDGAKVIDIIGNVFGMTRANLNFCRKAIAIPQNDEESELLKRTGIFMNHDLLDPENRGHQHLGVFKRLQDIAVEGTNSTFDDPIEELNLVAQATT